LAGVPGDVSKALFDQNVQGRAEVHRLRSFDYLREADGKAFDVVYIDGDHEAKSVVEDFVLSWPLVSVGGIIVLDDYEWNDTPLMPPRPAIDALLHVYGSRIAVLYKGWQVIVRKVAE
jgi:predicted O-methyltransferase YrrM